MKGIMVVLLLLLWAAPGFAEAMEQVEAQFIDMGDLTLKGGEILKEVHIRPDVINEAVGEVYGDRVTSAGDINSARHLFAALMSGDDEKFWQLTRDTARDRGFSLFMDVMGQVETMTEASAAEGASAIGQSYNQRMAGGLARRLVRYFPRAATAPKISFAGQTASFLFWTQLAVMVADYAGQQFDAAEVNTFMRRYAMLRLTGVDATLAPAYLSRGEQQVVEAFRRTRDHENIDSRWLYNFAEVNFQQMLRNNERFKAAIRARALEMREKIEARTNRRIQVGMEAAERDIASLAMLVKYHPEEAVEARRKMTWEYAMENPARYRAIFDYYRQRDEEIGVEKEREEQEYAANRATLQGLYATLFDSTVRLAYDPDRPDYAPAETYRASGEYPPYLGARLWPWQQNVNDGTIANYFIANLRKVFIETIYKAPDRALMFGNAQVMVSDYRQNLRTFKYMAYAILNDAYTIAAQYAGQKRYRLNGGVCRGTSYLIEVVDVPEMLYSCITHLPLGTRSGPLSCCHLAKETQTGSHREEHWGMHYSWDPLHVDYWPYQYRSRADAEREAVVRGARVSEIYRFANASRNGYVMRDPLASTAAPFLQPNSNVFAHCETREVLDGVSREEAMNLIFRPVAQAYIACLADFKTRYRAQEDALAEVLLSLRTWRDLTRRNVNPKYDRLFRHGSGVYGLTEAATDPLAPLVRVLEQQAVDPSRPGGQRNTPGALGAAAYSAGSAAMFRIVQEPGREPQERARVVQSLRQDLDGVEPQARGQALAQARANLRQQQQDIRHGLPTAEEVRLKQNALQAALRQTALQAGDPYARERLQAMGLPPGGAVDVYNELPVGEVAELVFADERATAQFVPGGYRFDYGSGINADKAEETGKAVIDMQGDVDVLQYRAEMLDRLAGAYGAIDESLRTLEAENAWMLANRAQVMQAIRRWLREDNPELTGIARQAQQPELARIAGQTLGLLAVNGVSLPAAPPFTNLILAENRFPRLADIRNETARAQLAALTEEFNRTASAQRAEIAVYGARYTTIRDNYAKIVDMLNLYRPTGPELAQLVRELNAEGFNPQGMAQWEDFDRQARARLAQVAFSPDDLTALQRLYAKLAGGALAGTVQVDMTALAEKTLRDMANAYENQSVGSFMRLVDRNFTSPLTNAKDYQQLEQSLRDDFRNFSTPRLWLYLRGRPAYYPDRKLVAIDCTWSRKLLLRRSGEEWEVRDRQSRMVFSVQDDGTFKLCNLESGDVLFGLSDFRGRVTIDEGTVNGQEVTGAVLLENGTVVAASGSGTTGTAASATVTAGSANNVALTDAAGWWTYSFMAPGYFTNTACGTREASFNLKSPGDGTMTIAGYRLAPGGVQLLGFGAIDGFSTVPTVGYDAGEVTAVAGQVYAVKTTTGKYAKVKITAVAYDGTKITVSFDWRFQNNGTPNF